MTTFCFDFPTFLMCKLSKIIFWFFVNLKKCHQNLLQNGFRPSHFAMVDPVTVLKTLVIVGCSINFARLSNNAVTYLISVEKLLLNQHNEYSGPVCQPLGSLKSWEIASLEKILMETSCMNRFLQLLWPKSLYIFKKKITVFLPSLYAIF